jgi:hypothetical protein
LYQVSETRVQSLIARDRYWLQQIDGDALLAVVQRLAMLNQRCQEKTLQGLLSIITDLAVSNALPEMASKSISYSQVLEYVKRLKPNWRYKWL